MDTEDVNRTLAATQKLLDALNEDPTLLNDDAFMQKLSFLRSQHKNTTAYLEKIVSSGYAEHENGEYISDIEAPFVRRHFEPLGREHSGYCSPCAREFARAPEWSDSQAAQRHRCREHYEEYEYQRPTTSKHRDYEEEDREHYADDDRHIDKTRSRSERSSLSTYPRGIMKKRSGSIPRFPDPDDDYHSDEKGTQSLRGDGRDHWRDNSDRRAIASAEIREWRRMQRPAPSYMKQNGPVPRSNLQNGLVGRTKSLHDLRSKHTAFEQRKEWIPQVTVPKPFKMSQRTPKVNTYSQKYVQSLIEEKKAKEEEELNREIMKSKFKARPPPKSTYIPENARVLDAKYVETIQRRVEANMKARRLRGWKSTGDLAESGKKARPVPVSTYIGPTIKIAVKREKKTHERSLNMLKEASTPPGIFEHTVITKVRQNLRHQHCTEESENRIHRSKSVPDFAALHRRLNGRLLSGKKPPTVQKPFNFTYKSPERHKKCLSKSPPPTHIHRPVPIPASDPPPVQMTRTSNLRQQAVKKRMSNKWKVENAAKEFWESRREEMDENRRRLVETLGHSDDVNAIIERKTREKVQNWKETTQEYNKQLDEMRLRVLSRPLVMEQQASLIQKHAFEKKYQQRMKEFETKSKSASKLLRFPAHVARQDSKGTFVVESPEELWSKESKERPGKDASNSSDQFESDSESEKEEDKIKSATSKSSSLNNSSASKASATSKVESNSGSSNEEAQKSGSRVSSSRSSASSSTTSSSTKSSKKSPTSNSSAKSSKS